jgi:uncharacterized membrane protein
MEALLGELFGALFGTLFGTLFGILFVAWIGTLFRGLF